MSKVPVTSAGLLVVTLGVLAYVAGWQLGWVELMIVAAASGVAMLIAIPFVIGRLSLDVSHTIVPRRVKAFAQPGPVASLQVRNHSTRTVRSHTIEDEIGGEVHVVKVRDLSAGESTSPVDFRLSTARRGRIDIGPALATRQDPLRLLRRAVVHAERESCWIHPYYEALTPLSAGFAKDMEGPTTDSSPAGDVAFHTLREYVPGDDYRHIHWMSSARRHDGQPVVRHYVDNRRPHLLVLLDDRAEALAGDEFECALQIVASLVASAAQHRETIAVWSVGGPVIGRALPGTTDDALDRLAEAGTRTGGDVVETALAGIRSERTASALVWITGTLTTEQLAPVVSQVRRRVKTIIVRVGEGAEPVRVQGAGIHDVRNLADFRLAWRRLAR